MLNPFHLVKTAKGKKKILCAYQESLIVNLETKSLKKSCADPIHRRAKWNDGINVKK